MKILLSGYHNPHFLTITEYVERAIQSLGHSLLTFDDRNFLFPGRWRQRSAFLHRFDLKRLNRRLMALALRENPDLCVVLGGHRILPETVERLKGRGFRTALWTIDAPLDFSPVKAAAPFYAHVFCGGTEARELLETAGIPATHWLPFACDPEIHHSEDLNAQERKEWTSDLALVGSFYPNRARMLEAVSDFDLKIWGPGWKKLPPENPLGKKARERMLKPEEWRKIFSGVKINIVIHYQDGRTPCYQASPRIYEVLACQGFLLVDDQKDVKQLFDDGKHLVIFNNAKDLIEKIVHYLHHPEQRQKIAQQGHEEVIRKHTYLHRIREMLSVIEGRPARPLMNAARKQAEN